MGERASYKSKKVELKLKTLAIGMLIRRIPLRELIREYSLKPRYMKYYDLNTANICSRIRKVPQGIGTKITF